MGGCDVSCSVDEVYCDIVRGLLLVQVAQYGN